TLLGGTRRAIVLGGLTLRHSRYADLRAAAAALAALTGATLGWLADGGNAVGAALAGALPHRAAGGRAAPHAGLDTSGMLAAPLSACVLFGGIEPEADFGGRDATAALAACPLVIAMTPYASESLRRVAHLLLPIGTFAETSGTFVNCCGQWQEFGGCARPVGAARPGWKVLRVLGNLLGLEGFDFPTPEELRSALRQDAGTPARGEFTGTRIIEPGAGGTTTAVPMYRADAILRRATPLQVTRAGRLATD
ncbi:MAG: NADH-quinone oxidoreductase subunit G, partial [Gammaproteobacteria bacterium]|nr:NADH-quinone oxidoreductase subunit G [Gammaproteobacteria bacterium]